MRAKETDVVHGYPENCFQYMLVLNCISVNDSLPVPLCRAMADYWVQKKLTILHRFSSVLEEWGDYDCNLWTLVSKAQRIISLTCVIALFNCPNVFFIPDSSAMLFFCISVVIEARMAGCESYSITLWIELHPLGKAYSCSLIQPQNLHLCDTAFAHQIKFSY